MSEKGELHKDEIGYFVKWKRVETLRTRNIFRAVRWLLYGNEFGPKYHHAAPENGPRRPRSKMTKERAKEVFEQCKKQSGYGPWSDQLEKVMSEKEYKEVKRLWLNRRSGSSSFSSTFLCIMNGQPLD